VTRYPGVFAVGDVNSVGTPKAGVFAEGAAKVVAEILIAQAQGAKGPAPYNGAGACYVEFGEGQVGRVDVNFLSGPSPTGRFTPPTPATFEEKQEFGASRRARWFGV
jgi:sulfide:quinone oxidoreductase